MKKSKIGCLCIISLSCQLAALPGSAKKKKAVIFKRARM